MNDKPVLSFRIPTTKSVTTINKQIKEKNVKISRIII